MIEGPTIVERAAEPYAGIRRRVTLPFDDVIPGIMQDLEAALSAHGLVPAGPVFFKHDVIDMPYLEMTFGVPLAAPAAPSGELVTGVLPAGRYGEVTYWGHYDGLMDANRDLIEWARANHITWDCEEKPDGDHFASRMEIYFNSPEEEPDPDKLKTIVTIRIAD